MGIEPTAQAWEAWVLPLYDARDRRHSNAFHAFQQIAQKSKYLPSVMVDSEVE